MITLNLRIFESPYTICMCNVRYLFYIHTEPVTSIHTYINTYIERGEEPRLIAKAPLKERTDKVQLEMKERKKENSVQNQNPLQEVTSK